MKWPQRRSRNCSADAGSWTPAQIEDVVIGCAFPEGEQGMNMARMIALAGGSAQSVPAETINRYCSSGVQSIAHVAYAIKAGDIEMGIAGGAESMTMVPMTGYKFSPNPYFAQDLPHYYTNMGLTAENVSVKYGISREDQDRFSVKSHQKAAQAVEFGIVRSRAGADRGGGDRICRRQGGETIALR